ncbi:MAG: carbon-nitrogen hydrolase family protein [Thermoplasmata archaeon]
MPEFTIKGIELRRMNVESALIFLKQEGIKMFSGPFPHILALPEKWITEAIEEDSSVISMLCDLSDKHGSVIVPGSFTVKRDGRLYNSAPVISDGKILGWQDKISLYLDEKKKYTRGSNVYTFSTPYGRIAAPVCYDLDFPYFCKIASSKGASIVINPSLIREPFHSEWELYVRARSLENRLCVASINSISEPFNGNSVISIPFMDGYGARIRVHRSMGASVTAAVDPEVIASMAKIRSSEDPGIYSFQSGTVNDL